MLILHLLEDNLMEHTTTFQNILETSTLPYHHGQTRSKLWQRLQDMVLAKTMQIVPSFVITNTTTT